MVAESPTVIDLPEATCQDCLAFQPEKFDDNERILGACGLRPEMGLLPENYPWCDQFRMKPSRKGKIAEPEKKRAAGQPKEPGAPRSGTRRGLSYGGGSVARPAAKRRATLRSPVTGDTQGDYEVDRDGLKQVLRELLEEETLYGYVEMSDRWQGGEIEIKPADSSLQSKTLEIDVLFHKIVMVRDKLRVLEQKINTHDKLSVGDKVELQQYVTRCYGSLTNFNILFSDKADHFTTKG
jgi:hypothetical protein